MLPLLSCEKIGRAVDRQDVEYSEFRRSSTETDQQRHPETEAQPTLDRVFASVDHQPRSHALGPLPQRPEQAGRRHHAGYDVGRENLTQNTDTRFHRKVSPIPAA